MRDARQVVAVSAVVLTLASVAPTQALTAAATASTVPVSSCWGDENGRPELTGLVLSTDAVDVRTAAQAVMVRATAVDTGGPGAPSGVASITVQLLSPREISEDELPEIPATTLRPDATGTWVGRAVLPRRTTGGTWKVGSVALRDASIGMHNAREYGPDDMLAAGFTAPTLQVTSVVDHTKPTLASFALSKRVVDTRHKARSVKVTVRARDVASGVRTVSVNAYEAGTQNVLIATMHRRSGTASDGIWVGRLPVRRWLTNGTWNVFMAIYDQALNSRVLRTRHGRLGRTRFISSFRVISGADSRRPSASSVHSSPAAVDVRSVNGAVQLRVHAADAASGVAAVRVLFTGPNGWGPLKADLHRTHGTSHSGIWVGTLAVRHCMGVAGRWTGVVRVTDRAGNVGRISPASLSFVEAAGDNDTPSSRLSSPVAAAGPAVLTFDEDVVGVSSDSIELRAAFTYPPSGPLAGTWTCSAASGTAVDCLAGPVRVAAFTPATPFVAKLIHVDVNPEHHLDITDLAGNPAFTPFQAEFEVKP